jgi:hypothetical protein
VQWVPAPAFHDGGRHERGGAGGGAGGGPSAADAEVLASLGVAPLDRLFNPRPFSLAGEEEPEQPEQPEQRRPDRQLKKRYKSGVWDSAGGTGVNEYLV